MLTRRGTSLAELVVALALIAIILASATGTLLRHQRSVTGMVTAGHADAQLRAAVAVLPSQLALLSPSAEDFVDGEVRDTALQLRMTVASGLACDTATTVTFAVDSPDAGDPPAGGVASAPRPGDSLWWYLADSSRWTGARVTDAWADTLPCATAAWSGNPNTARRVQRVMSDAAGSIAGLAPLRVTRQARYTLYRSGDGTWQLGFREWSDVTHSLSVAQPLAGPFERIAPDGARTGFRYFDAAGVPLAPESDATARGRIARIRFTALALPAAVPGRGQQESRRDSVEVAIQRPAAP